ncbi:hypothetical protein GPECTOR_2191g1152 [Gonium pectorale]|uniref:Uncharacterized protein n=1 Tax=Gonium pectorale TaxID=33097 RepID=A0A150FT67_GONPE|nr:hypothetical protein GPECTOR_2191g1152 [Gonium pectorale]|eukprot:KXZ40813.1 hypothetical protein GPECTOR_2191g1152 [Gonium pectorale]
MRLALPSRLMSGFPLLDLGDHFKVGDSVVAEVAMQRTAVSRPAARRRCGAAAAAEGGAAAGAAAGAGSRAGGRAVLRRVLSTVRLEREPGAILRDPAAVFVAAAETLALRESGQAPFPAPSGSRQPRREGRRFAKAARLG